LEKTFSLSTIILMDTATVKTLQPDWTARTTLTVTETADVLRIGRSAAYEAIRAGQIPSLRIGRRVLVPVSALVALLNQPSP
jgi:excisionase family DNA binding protein